VQWFGNNTNCKGVCRGVPEIRAVRGGTSAVLHRRQSVHGRGACSPCSKSPSHSRRIGVSWSCTCSAVMGRDTTCATRASSRSSRPSAAKRTSRSAASRTSSTPTTTRVLYTDHLLANAIRSLQALGESCRHRAASMFPTTASRLARTGFSLHALPYAIAPDLQTHVPMVFWASSRVRTADGPRSRPACIAAADAPLSHDNIFHSVLGLMDIETAARSAALDHVRELSQDRLADIPRNHQAERPS
jgi:lipid A ethanolaminephosphotransferase